MLKGSELSLLPEIMTMISGIRIPLNLVPNFFGLRFSLFIYVVLSSSREKKQITTE